MSPFEVQKNLSSNDVEKLLSASRKKLVVTFSAASSFVFLMFGSVYLSNGQFLIGTLEFLLGLTLIGNILYTQKTGKTESSGRVMVYSVYVMFLIIFYTGGIGNTGNIWIVFIPLFTAMVLGEKEGRKAIIIFSFTLAVIVTAHFYEVITLKFENVMIRQTLIIYALVVYLSGVNEKTKNIVRKKLAETNSLLGRASRTDFLTNILNRFAVNEQLEKSFAEYQRHEQPVSLVMIDLDHFKEINDEFGHTAGDTVLKEFTSLIKEQIRLEDTFGRWGGEEFVIILKGTDLEKAEHVVEKLRLSIENHQFSIKQIITASFGVTELKNSYSFEAWVNRSDDLMYEAKRGGRNCTVADVA